MSNKGEIILSFFYAWGKTKRNNEKIPSLTHLQKEIFLLSKRTPFSVRKDLFKFVPLWYGPFSIDLSQELTDLQNKGLIGYDELSLSKNGFREASIAWGKLSDDEKKQIIDVKATYNFFSTIELIDYVYSMYPKFTKKSALKKEVVDQYFSDYLKENNLTEEDAVSAVILAKKIMRERDASNYRH
ncbi:MAG: hypothetical protein ACYCPR_07080 [Thermoplasmataceae archaeon]|jgi:uncharacterized protein YwgA